jgi:formylglycine-generating enzyme required for sulfatase activity
MPEAASKLLPDNGETLTSVTADLNGDGTMDFLVAFEYLDGTRQLFIIVREGKKYRVASTSTRSILCKTCGGVYGEPFQGLAAEKKSFSISHFGGSNFKWANTAVFGYSRRDRKWQLVEFTDTQYDLENNDTVTVLRPADFGLINLEDYDLDHYMSEGKIEAVPDEATVAAREQQTAEAEARYTPTPIPTYVYDHPSQLKNRELVPFPGGPIRQSEGKFSFKNDLSPFRIGKDCVSYELWYVVKQWAVKNGYKFEMDGMAHDYGQGELPEKDSSASVRGVSWRDAIVWCNAYSQMMKLKPFYYSDHGFKRPLRSSVFGDHASSEDPTKGSFDNPYVDWSADGYRLPTESEWLYAVTYVNGKKWSPTSATDNPSNGSGFQFYPGNVSEWLWDPYAPYPSKNAKDYRGPATVVAPKVLHGGADPGTMKHAPLGQRLNAYPLVCSLLNGFRVAQNGR